MKLKSAKYVDVDIFTKVEVEIEHDGVEYKGSLEFENDGRDAEINDFEPKLPDELKENFWREFWGKDVAEHNNEILEEPLKKGYEEWEKKRAAA